MIEQAMKAQQGMSPNRDYDRSEYGRGEATTTAPSRDLYRVTALQGGRAERYWAWAWSPEDAVRQVTQQRDCEPQAAVEELPTVFTVEVC
jgi:hypothetical protein